VKLGLGSFAYAWAIGVPGFPPPRPMSAIDLVERAAELGVHVVQIGDNLPLHTLQPAQLRALEAAAQACRVDIEVGTRGIAPEHLERYLDLATRFSSRVLRVVVDTPDHRPSEGEVLSTLKPLLPSFEAQGVVLAIENHDRFAATTLARLITELNSPAVGICLDTANSLGALEGTKEVVATLAPFTVNLHVKDVGAEQRDHGVRGRRPPGRRRDDRHPLAAAAGGVERSRAQRDPRTLAAQAFVAGGEHRYRGRLGANQRHVPAETHRFMNERGRP